MQGCSPERSHTTLNLFSRGSECSCADYSIFYDVEVNSLWVGASKMLSQTSPDAMTPDLSSLQFAVVSLKPDTYKP